MSGLVLVDCTLRFLPGCYSSAGEAQRIHADAMSSARLSDLGDPFQIVHTPPLQRSKHRLQRFSELG